MVVGGGGVGARSFYFLEYLKTTRFLSVKTESPLTVKRVCSRTEGMWWGGGGGTHINVVGVDVVRVGVTKKWVELNPVAVI